MKKQGSMLIEVIISVFLLMILILCTAPFLKMVLIIEKTKEKTQKKTENIYNVMDQIEKIIINSKKVSVYEDEIKILDIKESNIVIRKEEDKLLIEKDKNIINLGEFLEIKMKKHENLLYIKLQKDKNMLVERVWYLFE